MTEKLNGLFGSSKGAANNKNQGVRIRKVNLWMILAGAVAIVAGTLVLFFFKPGSGWRIGLFIVIIALSAASELILAYVKFEEAFSEFGFLFYVAWGSFVLGVIPLVILSAVNEWCFVYLFSAVTTLLIFDSITRRVLEKYKHYSRKNKARLFFPIIYIAAFSAAVFSFLFLPGLIIKNDINFQYEISGSEIALTKYIGKKDEVVIPSAYAFKSNIFSKKKVYNVTKIGKGAFSGCGSFTRITIPDSVTVIGERAFENCIGLTGITIPDSVEIIGECAFVGCNNLESMTLPFAGASREAALLYGFAADTVFGYIFDYPEYTGVENAIQYYAKVEGGLKVASFSIPPKLSTVTITDTKKIGFGAFSGCTGLTSITLPDGVTNIGPYAFYGCNGLTDMVIPESMEDIGFMAFGSCESLKTFTWLADLNTEKSLYKYGFSILKGCEALESLTLPSASQMGYTHFGAWFGADRDDSCSKQASCVPKSLKEVTILDEMWTRASAFEECAYIERVVLSPSWAEAINSRAFYGCSGLTSITIPDGVEYIGASAFYGCSDLTSVTIPAGVTDVGAAAFSGWTNTQTITVQGKANEAAADEAWGAGWRDGCAAVIIYRP